MVAAPEYSLVVQTKMVPALCVLHNFIHVHDPDDAEEEGEEAEMDTNQAVQVVQQRVEDFGHTITPAERARAGQKRDDIAEAMWAQYIEYTMNEN
jgi:hypothetical protein